MYIGVRAGLLAASAIWAISTAAAQAEDLQAPAAAASASALTDGETKNLVVAQADTGQAPVQVAQLGVEHVTISARERSQALARREVRTSPSQTRCATTSAAAGSSPAANSPPSCSSPPSSPSPPALPIVRWPHSPRKAWSRSREAVALSSSALSNP